MIGTNVRPSNPEAMEPWQSLLVIVIVLVATFVAARLIDRRIMGANRSPEAMTRYRVLRRTISAAIVFVGLLSALLVIPQVRAVAGGILASSAVLGPDHRLRRPADARQLRRRAPDRDQPAAAARRPGRGRRREGVGRGDRPDVHVHPHRGRRPARDPEREACLGYHPQLHDPQRGEVRRGHRAGSAFSRSRRARRGLRAEVRGRARRGLRQLARRRRRPDAARRAPESEPRPSSSSTTSGCARTRRLRELGRLRMSPPLARPRRSTTSSTPRRRRSASAVARRSIAAARRRARSSSPSSRSLLRRRRRGGHGVATFGSQLRPHVAAAGRDRPELVRLRGRRLAARRRSRRSGTASRSRSRRSARGCRRRRSRSRTGASTSTAASTRGHRARALGGRERRQGRPGRLDDHAAARAQPLHHAASGRSSGS